MKDDVETLEVDGLTVRIVYDEDPQNPREWDEMGKIITWHRRDNFGDDHNYRDPEEFLLAVIGDGRFSDRLEDWYERKSQMIYDSCRHGSDEYYRRHDELMAEKRGRIMRRAEKSAIILPVYLYDHSGYALSTGPFSCPWDSGQIGFTYVKLDKVRHEFSVKRISKKVRQQAIDLLKIELNTYDDFINGRCYGFIVEDEDGDQLNSCWGIYGLDYAIEEATSAAIEEAKSRRDAERIAEEFGPRGQETAP